MPGMPPTTYTYDYNIGLPATLTGPNGPSTTITVTYDTFGRVLNLIRPGDDLGNPTLQAIYNDPPAASRLWVELRQRVEGGQYAAWRKHYNGLGQLIQSQTMGAQVWDTGSGTQVSRTLVQDTWYDAYGQVIRQSTPYSSTQTSGYITPIQSIPATYTSYDGLGRPSLATGTDGTQTRYGYFDLTTVVTDTLSHPTTTLFDVWGRTVEVVPPTGPEVEYAYDTQDRLVLATYGPVTATTQITYTLSGLKAAMKDPDMGEWSYGYDTLGNLTQQTDARLCTTSLSYDLLNRLTGKTYTTGCPATEPVSYGYDAGTNGWGRRTSMSDGSGSTTWNYDARGQVITETRTITGSLGTFVTAWGYNSAGQVDWMRYPQDNLGNPGERVDYSYNNQLALDSTTGITGTQAITYVLGTRYDVAGRVVQRILGQNAVLNQYQYYNWNEQGGGRLKQLTSGVGGNLTSLQDLNYTYDNMGNMLTIVDNRAPDGPQTQSFTYDTLYRLLSATATPMGSAGAYQESYSYAPDTGNILTKGGTTYFYTDNLHAHAVTSRSNGESFQYDPNGNMTQRTINGQIYNLIYDAENRLVQVSGAATASYYYNGDGQRVLVTNGTNTTIYVGNYFEWEVEQSTAVQYYYSGAVRVAMRRGGNSPLWLLNDHLDSTSVVANLDGTLHSFQYYTAWGEKRYPQGASNLSTKYRYTGQLEDSFTGLYWFGSRWYDPQLGRFLQADPLIPEFTQGSQAWDRYAFVNNNPLKFIDRNGHDAGCSAANPVCRGLSGYPTTSPPYAEVPLEKPSLTFGLENWEESVPPDTGTVSLDSLKTHVQTLLDIASQGTTVLPTMGDETIFNKYTNALPKATFGNAGLTLSGGVLSATSDYLSTEGYSVSYRLAHAFTYGVESIGLSTFSNGVGVINGVPFATAGGIIGTSFGGPIGAKFGFILGGAAGYAGGYSITYKVGQQYIDEFNREFVNPWLYEIYPTDYCPLPD